MARLYRTENRLKTTTAWKVQPDGGFCAEACRQPPRRTIDSLGPFTGSIRPRVSPAGFAAPQFAVRSSSMIPPVGPSAQKKPRQLVTAVGACWKCTRSAQRVSAGHGDSPTPSAAAPSARQVFQSTNKPTRWRATPRNFAENSGKPRVAAVASCQLRLSAKPRRWRTLKPWYRLGYLCQLSRACEDQCGSLPQW